MKKKVKVWLRRYLPAEVIAVCTALIGGMTIHSLFHNPILTALGGTWGEFAGYYGVIILKDLRALKTKHTQVTIPIVIKLLRNLLVEFGPSEYLDSFIIRPFAMYIFPLIIHNVYIGLILGKFAADITFYIPTIISYELKNKYIGD